MAKYRKIKLHKNSRHARNRRETVKLTKAETQNATLTIMDEDSSTTEPAEFETIQEVDTKITSKAIINGRRLISIESMLDSMNKAYNHGRSCTMEGSLEISKEKQLGLQSIITFTCAGCQTQIVHDTNSDNCTLPVNDAIVWGTYAGGSAYKTSEHLCTVLEVPFLSFNTYQKHERTVMSIWDDALYQTILRNGEEEVQRARSAGNILNIEGKDYPYTTVCVDAAWSSRSYGHTFKSKGSVAVILSKATNKLLHVGIRNRFCLMCKKQESTGVYREHFCFKNWGTDQSAQSMESDIILQGFRTSLEMHGLVYKRMLGDGDSSVFMTLVSSNVYSGIEIEKIECVNHAVKRFNKSLIVVSENTQLFPLAQRNMLKKNIHRFGLGLRSAIVYNHRSETSCTATLRKDILNIPFHVFGEHKDCRDYFCTEERKSEENFVASIIDQPIWNAIQAIISRAANNASRLIQNLTTNSAESFMNRVAKFNMGKRINTILKGGWHMRVTAAALSFHFGPCFYKNVFKLVTGRIPGRIWERASEPTKFVTRLKKKAKRHLFPARNRIVAPTPSGPGRIGDADYGSNPAYPDKSDETVSQLLRELIANKQVTIEERNQIEMETIGQGSNSKWLFHRHGRITASHVGNLYGLRDSTNNRVTLDKLLRPQSIGHVKSIQNGQDFEGPARRAYTALPGNVVTECGLFISLENRIFAASPDGLVGDDGIVEIKCPFSLVGHPPTGIPSMMKNSCLKSSSADPEILELCRSSHYYKQVVMQLHVTGRSWCDFVVYTFKIQGKMTIKFDPFIDRIYRNSDTLNLWNSMKTKFEKFYEMDIGPEVVDSRIERSLPNRQPPYRKVAMNKIETKRRSQASAENIRNEEVSSVQTEGIPALQPLI